MAPKTTDTPTAEPTIADRVAAARAHRAASADVAPGTVCNAVEGLRYSVVVKRDYADAQYASLVEMLKRRGYTPATNGEFLIAEPDAQVFAAPKEIGDDEWKDEFLEKLLTLSWVRLQERRHNHGIARRVFEIALRVHDERVPAEGRRAARAELTALVRNSDIGVLQARY